jgi:aminodeoxyfutalosine synthase
MLDNFAHIKSYWQMVSLEMAQISLRFGANDIDGTVIEEKVYDDARACAVRAGHDVLGAVKRSEDSFTVTV